MGLIDFFKPKREQIKETRSALEAANDPSVDEGAASQAIGKVMTMLLDIGLDGRGPIKSAGQVASAAKKEPARARRPSGPSPAAPCSAAASVAS